MADAMETRKDELEIERKSSHNTLPGREWAKAAGSREPLADCCCLKLFFTRFNKSCSAVALALLVVVVVAAVGVAGAELLASVVVGDTICWLGTIGLVGTCRW